MSKKLAFYVVILVLVAIGISSAQTLKNLVHQPPDGAIVGFLMTDGTVMYQVTSTPIGGGSHPTNLEAT